MKSNCDITSVMDANKELGAQMRKGATFYVVVLIIFSLGLSVVSFRFGYVDLGIICILCCVFDVLSLYLLRKAFQ